ncbi:unnamed protein product [Phytomonas sp. EM1]|nr:unnamed protein product [Phytomonas sp. EM1]|eukprot:CCW64343.1 unnamed protein product [Phytomonas sp. isolate EM1]
MQNSEPSYGNVVSTTAPCKMRQSSYVFSHDEEEGGKKLEKLTMHLSARGFLDAVWIFATEDENCCPGVILRHDAGLLAGSGGFFLDGEIPSLGCEVLLGVRDDPLTNLLASKIVHSVRKYGEERPIILCLSVVKTGKRLRSMEEKKRFLEEVKVEVIRLVTGEGALSR